MKRALTLFLFPLLASAVFGDADKDGSVSLKKGDSVTLHTNAGLLRDDQIEWRFNNTRIARVIRNNAVYDTDVKFRDRLQLDDDTGDLKITNFRLTDSGLYKFEIDSPRVSSEKTFSVTGVSYTGVNSVSVLEGDSVTLHSSVSEIQRDDVIRWRFNNQNPPVAEISRKTGIFNTSDGADGRFRDRLQLEYWTGSLTVRNIGTKHSGLYDVGIRSGSSRYTTHKSFNVTVSDGVKSVSVMKRASVPLQTDTEIQRDDLMQWMFGDSVIAEILKADHRLFTFAGPDGKFKHRLELDETGSLSIKDSGYTDSGDYQLKISSSRFTINRKITVTVTGLSPAAKAGIGVGVGLGVVLLVVVVVLAVGLAAVVIHYRHRITELEERTFWEHARGLLSDLGNAALLKMRLKTSRRKEKRRSRSVF